MLDVLKKFGWLDQAATEIPDLVKRAYIAYLALKNLEEPVVRFCNLPDVAPVRSGLCKWPTNDVTWSILNTPKGLAFNDVQAAYARAWNGWAKVCAIRPRYTANNPQAMVVMDVRDIDGPMGVLAESQLPCGGIGQCHQWFDNTENFVISINPAPNVIDLERVAEHEIGHAIGFDHIGAGNLMAPVYSLQIRSPQAGDIQLAQARYPGPGLTDITPTNIITINVQGQVDIPGYRLTKIMT